MHDREAYGRPLDEVIARLETSLESGLSGKEASKRLADLGANELAQEERVSPVRLFFAQFKNTLIIILLVATILSALLGEIVDAAIIAVFVLPGVSRGQCALGAQEDAGADDPRAARRRGGARPVAGARPRRHHAAGGGRPHSGGRAARRNSFAQVRRSAVDR
jgi:hypothetical protein